MPNYPFMCDKCSLEEDIFMTVAEYTDDQKCPMCAKKMRRIFTASALSIPDYAQYRKSLGPNAREMIKSGKVTNAEDFKYYKPPVKKKYEITNDDLQRAGIN